jgi:hypothetical protein
MLVHCLKHLQQYLDGWDESNIKKHNQIALLVREHSFSRGGGSKGVNDKGAKVGGRGSVVFFKLKMGESEKNSRV